MVNELVESEVGQVRRVYILYIKCSLDNKRYIKINCLDLLGYECLEIVKFCRLLLSL